MKIKVVMRRGRPPSTPLKGSTLGAGVNPAAAHFRQQEQKGILNYTFEAGMCMKTKDHKTQCPNRNRHLGLNLRHLRRIEHSFCRQMRISDAICQVHSVFREYPPLTTEGWLISAAKVRIVVSFGGATGVPPVNGHGQDGRATPNDTKAGCLLRRQASPCDNAAMAVTRQTFWRVC